MGISLVVWRDRDQHDCKLQLLYSQYEGDYKFYLLYMKELKSHEQKKHQTSKLGKLSDSKVISRVNNQFWFFFFLDM